MDVNHGETGGLVPPEFGVGEASTKCPPHILLCFKISDCLHYIDNAEKCNAYIGLLTMMAIGDKLGLHIIPFS